MATNGPSAVRVFDLDIRAEGEEVRVQALEDAGYHVTHDTEPFTIVSPNDQIEIPRGRSVDDLCGALNALQLPAPAGAKPAFRPGPTASADIAARYIRDTYPHEERAITHVVTRYTTVEGEIADVQPRMASARRTDDYNFSERDAILLARGLAGKIPAHELPLLRTGIESIVPRGMAQRPYDLHSQMQAGQERTAFINAFRSELEAQPQWVR